MQKDLKENTGIQVLLKEYRKQFRIPENLRYYAKTDLKIAERKFLKHALSERKLEIQR